MLKFICVLQYSRALAIKILCQKIIKNQYKSSSTTHLKTTSYFQHIFTPFRPPFRPQKSPKIDLKINTSQLNTCQINTYQLNTSQCNTTHQKKSKKNTSKRNHTLSNAKGNQSELWGTTRWPHTSLY